VANVVFDVDKLALQRASVSEQQSKLVAFLALDMDGPIPA
jgi:hypothetical protein